MKKGVHRLPAITKMLCDESGETLVETLASVLISSLALLLLATAIGTSVNIVMRSKDNMQQFYGQESSLAQGGDGPAASGSIDSGSIDVSVALREDEIGSSVYVDVVKAKDNDNLSLYSRR